MLRKNLAKEKIKSGQVVIGCRMDFASPFVAETMGKAGFDFVYFDCEHSTLSHGDCEEMVRAAELTGMTPLVRVESPEPWTILRYVDSGIMGVILPHCHTKATAEAAIRAVKYHPEGERGIAGRSFMLSGMSVPDYLKAANEEMLVCVMIEDVEGLKHLPEILAVEGLDVIFIGRLDLSITMGIPGQVDNPAILEAIKKLIPEARAAGKAVGVGAIDAGRPESVREFISQGAQFFSLNTGGILTSASKALLQKIKG